MTADSCADAQDGAAPRVVTGQDMMRIGRVGESRLISRLIALALAAVMALPMTARARSTPRIDTRPSNQEKRIDQGVSSGELTKPETRRLERCQTWVDRMENRAAADGKVTKRERHKIERAYDTHSRRIRRQNADNQHRPG